MNGEEGPAWLAPVTLEDWPTHTIESRDLYYRLPLRTGWSERPEASSTPSEQTHSYRGQLSSEWLVISFMPKADPKSYLGHWVEALIHLSGFPIPAMQAAFESNPELLEWKPEKGGGDLARRLQADEIFLYQGLAFLPGQPPDLARMYIILIRRGTQAWKVCLSFSSACPPGTPEEIVAANDHVRAGATLGHLELL